MRAILLAKATRTSIGGLRASMRPSHEPAGTPLRAAQRATALAPMISKRRSARSPILYQVSLMRTCRDKDGTVLPSDKTLGSLRMGSGLRDVGLDVLPSRSLPPLER